MRISYYIKSAFKSILSQGWDAVINIIGLSLGISICMVVLLYVRTELNYDRSYSGYQRIYRVYTEGHIGSRAFKSAMTPVPLAEYVRQNCDQVESAVKIVKGVNKLVSYKGKGFNEDHFFYGDFSFFNVFDVPFVLGNPHDALMKPDAIVITANTARKYFGEENPLGKQLKLDNGLVFYVSGVCKPLKESSHFHFDFMASTESIKQLYNGNYADSISYEKNWLRLNRYTYIKVKNGFNNASDQQKIIASLNKYIERKVDREMSFGMQPVKDIHLNSNMDNEIEANSKEIYVFLFVGIAIFVLLITCVNFINLTTAKIIGRIEELDVRKLVGIGRRDIVIMYVVESLVYSFLALFVGLTLVELFLPMFNHVFGLQLNFKHLDRKADLLIVALTTFCVGFFSGLYPAITFTSLRTYAVFDVITKYSYGKFWVRGILISFQMLVVGVLIMMSVGVYRQLSYLNKKNLGFISKNVVVVERGTALGENFNKVKQEFLQIKGVDVVSACSELPGDVASSYSFNYSTSEGEKAVLFPVSFVEQDFFELMGISFKSGRIWDKTDDKWSFGVVINEKARRMMPLLGGVGSHMEHIGTAKGNYDFVIDGIVEDFHFEPVQLPIRPLVMMELPEENFYDNLLIRKDENVPLDSIKAGLLNVWRKYTNGEPFECKMLDADLQKKLEEERQVLNMFILLAVFSFLAALLGLKAFSTFVGELRGEVVSIKYMLGASRESVFKDVFIDIMQYVIAGLLISIPVAYFILRLWLRAYAYFQTLSLFEIVTLYIVIFFIFSIFVLLTVRKKVKYAFYGKDKK